MRGNQFIILELLCWLAITFILLNPFYLRDREPSCLRGFCLFIIRCLKTRYNACLLLFTLTGILIANTAGLLTQSFLYGFLSALIFILLVFPSVFWYPYYLRHTNNVRYNGVWKKIGDWLEGPESPFS
jgi:hypothetical protein